MFYFYLKKNKKFKFRVVASKDQISTLKMAKIKQIVTGLNTVPGRQLTINKLNHIFTI